MPIDPVEWLATAQQIVNASAPSEVELRRAVSAAYYAVFHLLLKTATERFLGTNMDSSYQALYRSFQHPKMKDLCKLLDVTKLNQRHANALGFENPSADVREFARGFVQLQERRHRADYDPVSIQSLVDSQTLVQRAEDTMQAFARIPPQHQNAILLYMLVSVPTRDA